MKYRIFMWILWPSFLVAGLAEGLLFTLVHPEDIIFLGYPVQASHEAIYTIGFFVLWFFLALSSTLSIYILPGSLSDLNEKFDRSLF
jgi:hypothetical protein